MYHAGMNTLTARQEEALRLIMDGRTLPEVAQALGITTRTAKAHSETLRRKLGVEHKRQLILAGRDYFNGKGS